MTYLQDDKADSATRALAITLLFDLPVGTERAVGGADGREAASRAAVDAFDPTGHTAEHADCLRAVGVTYRDQLLCEEVRERCGACG